MPKVYLINTDKQPLDPIHPTATTQLLRNGKATIFQIFPFTLTLKEAKPQLQYFCLYSLHSVSFAIG
ncbi:hypothetical protein NUACC21_57080 [Scytonema sp. NUACC21]